MKHIAIVANKWWEVHPLCAVLLNDYARPPEIEDIKLISYPADPPQRPKTRPPDPAPLPRLSCQCVGCTVDVWCLQELMNPFESSSSSFEKARVLPASLATRAKPDLVIAFGTAGSRPGVAANGSVVVGRRVFIHDPLASEPDRTGMWTPPHQDIIVDSGFASSVFRKIDTESKHSAEARFLVTPIGPSAPLLLFGNGFVSLGVVNVTDYDQYFWADKSAVTAFAQADIRDGQIGSVETTHGVIRESCDAAFFFVSGIVDMEGLFDYQVSPRRYVQNFTGAHNAAVATAFLLPEVARLL